MPLPILGSRLLILINSTAFFWLIVALIVTHTDWVCRAARMLYLLNSMYSIVEVDRIQFDSAHGGARSARVVYLLNSMYSIIAQSNISPASGLWLHPAWPAHRLELAVRAKLV